MTTKKNNNILQQPKNIYQENVDLNEISKFNTIANCMWDVEGEFKLLHLMNPLRMSYILERTGGLFGKTVLDVGCGGGILAESMAWEGAKVTGLDVAADLLSVARIHAYESGLTINYYQQTVETHAKIHHNFYDIVTCMELLEHVPDPSSIIKGSARLVKPGGEVFFSTLNRNLKAWLMAIIGAEYVLHIVPRGIHKVMKFIKPAELLNWVDNTSLREQHIVGVHYNLLQNLFYFSSNVDINYILYTKREL